MTSQQLEYAEQRMQQKWYDLVQAEQQGASAQMLERLYNAYILAVEEFNRCSAEQQAAAQAQSIVAVPKSARRRKAS